MWRIHGLRVVRVPVAGMGLVLVLLRERVDGRVEGFLHRLWNTLRSIVVYW